MERLHDLTERMEQVERVRDFADIIRLLAKNSQSPIGAIRGALAEAEQSRSLPRVQRVLKGAVEGGSVSASTWGSELSYEGVTDAFLSLLSTRTLLGRIPFRQVPANTRTLTETAPGTASWIGEGRAIAVSRQSMDAIQLPPMKIGGLCVFTRELLSVASGPSLDAISRGMLNTVGRYSDQALINPDFAASTGVSPASLTNGASQISSTGSTEAAVSTDLGLLLDVHIDAGSDLTNVYLVMSPQTALFLSKLLTTGGVRAFPDIGVRGGTIWGLPVLTSTGAVCSGSPTENCIAAINVDGCLVTDAGIDVAASDQANIQMDDSPSGDATAGTATTLVSLWQVESRAIRFTRRLNFVRTGADAVSYMRVGY